MRIEEIDRNFKGQACSDDLNWVDAWNARRIAVRGHGWVREARKARSFRRIPERAAAPLTPAVQELTWCPASVFLSFATDSPELAVRLFNRDTTFMSHMPLTGSAGAELYEWVENAWVPVATARPSQENRCFERALFRDRSRGRREFRLYLPLYKAVESVAIGVKPRSRLEPLPAPEERKPIFFYGTSITQGGCANTAGSDYVSLVGRMLDRDTINFGFSGSGRGEPEVAELIREVDASLFVLDYVANASPEVLERTLPDFLRILRERHPHTPVVLMGSIGYNPLLQAVPKRREMLVKRDILLRFYVEAKAAGDPYLHYIDGHGLVPPGETGLFVDGTHPTSAGFRFMAERLAPQLRAILAVEE